MVESALREGQALSTRLAALPDDLLEHPALGDPRAAYAHLPGRRPGVRETLIALRGGDDAGTAVSELRISGGGRAAAFARLADAAFESECLQRRIARLTDLVAWGAGAPATATAVLRDAVRAARARGIELVLAATAAGSPAAAVLGDAGFAPVADKLTYFYLPEYGADVAPIRARHAVRPFRAQDRGALVALGRRFEHSQYRRLPGVSGEDVDRLYRSWIERACSGEFADTVLVAESAGGAVAFSSFKCRSDALAVAGLRVLGQGLGAVEPRASGALIALILRMRELVDGGAYDAAEFDFYAENATVRRSLERMGFRAVGRSTVAYLAP